MRSRLCELVGKGITDSGLYHTCTYKTASIAKHIYEDICLPILIGALQIHLAFYRDAFGKALLRLHELITGY
jgi:hypothetical protein